MRPNRLFTADESIVAYRAGKISNDKLNEVLSQLIAILKWPGAMASLIMSSLEPPSGVAERVSVSEALLGTIT